MKYRLGVDIGGTFTDIVLLELTAGTLRSAKIATDYDDPIGAILAGIKHLQLPAEAVVEALHHATTLSTNAVLENKLSTGALLTTQGFRDVLDIGRIQRPEEGIYDFNIDNPQPLIRRALRIEVKERIGARGEVVAPLDEDDLRIKLRQLKNRVETIAVCGLFSFVNPAHEQRIKAIIAQELPGIHISISSEVAPEIREFERSSTVVLDALLKPLLTPYLLSLDQRLAEKSITHTRIMLASGGLTSCRAAAAKPVNTINSGPSAGVLAAANLGRQLGIDDLITIDMGGTSLDIGVIEGGQPVHKYESKIAGFPLRAPAIDVAAVAAGGGSLALIDDLGFIQVDRLSAGSVPGPACYDRGGAKPTITDADVALGRLGVDLGGRGGFTLRADLARQAFTETICTELEVDEQTAAASVLDIIQARMVKAIASNTLEKGLDIRSLPLLVYGGAGPTHGVELADAMGMERVLIPYLAGNFSAIGLLLCPLRWDESQMILQPTNEISSTRLATLIDELATTAKQQMRHSSTESEHNFTTFTMFTIRWLAHMRYAGQSYDLAIDLQEPWPESSRGHINDELIARLVSKFHQQHQRHYAYSSQNEVVEIVQLRVSIAGDELAFPKPDVSALKNAEPIRKEQRDVYFSRDHQWQMTSVWDRATLAPGFTLNGPSIVEGEGSSALVPVGWQATVDEWLNLDVRAI